MLAPKLRTHACQRPKLVVADDSAEFRRLVRVAVGDAFTNVFEAGDGRELFWILARTFWDRPLSRDPDLVALVDVRMPVYGGLDVLEAWRDVESRLPVVVTTACPDELVRHRVDELGGRLLVKPFSLRELRLALALALA